MCQKLKLFSPCNSSKLQVLLKSFLQEDVEGG